MSSSIPSLSSAKLRALHLSDRERLRSEAKLGDPVVHEQNANKASKLVDKIERRIAALENRRPRYPQGWSVYHPDDVARVEQEKQRKSHP